MLWLKAFHIIAMVSWFAGLFYLPRLFVYHSRHPQGPVHEQFCLMERKLYRVIMNPAMVLTLVFGIWLAAMEWEALRGAVWFHIKMVLVLLLLFFHGLCGRYVRAFADFGCRRSERFFRLINEFPTLILVAVVILVVVKPF